MFSKDDNQLKFDPKLHTIGKLHDICDDLLLEYGCAYVFYYNMIMNMKDNKSLNNDKL